MKVLAKNECYQGQIWQKFRQLVRKIKEIPRLSRELEYIRLAYEADTMQPLIDGQPIKPWSFSPGRNLIELKSQHEESFNLVNDVARSLRPLRTEIQIEAQIGKPHSLFDL